MHLKRYFPSSLFRRTLLIIIAPVILLQLTSALVFFDRHWVKMTDRLSFAVAGEIAAIIDQIEADDADPDTVKVITALASSHLELLLSYIPDTSLNDVRQGQETLGGSLEIGIEADLAHALREQVRRDFDIHVEPDHKRIDVWIALNTKGVLHLSLPERRLFSSSGYIFILWLIGLSCLFFAISVLLMRNQIRPILRLAIAADRLGRGQDVSFFKPSGAKEVRQASEAFLKMRDRIRRQIEQRTAMLAGVSHDLRTPITRMKLQLEMMDGVEEQDIKDLKDDLHDMEVMVNAYLDFAKGEDGEAPQQTDIGQLLSGLVEKTTSGSASIQTDLLDHVSLSVSPHQFERAMTNIIGNALKHAGNLTLSMRIDKEEGYLRILFEDEGAGVPEDELENIFRPFYRVDHSRNSKSGGVGLGLSIAQDIIHRHGGSITVENIRDDFAQDQGEGRTNIKGLRVCVRLPV